MGFDKLGQEQKAEEPAKDELMELSLDKLDEFAGGVSARIDSRRESYETPAAPPLHFQD